MQRIFGGFWKLNWSKFQR